MANFILEAREELKVLRSEINQLKSDLRGFEDEFYDVESNFFEATDLLKNAIQHEDISSKMIEELREDLGGAMYDWKRAVDGLEDALRAAEPHTERVDSIIRELERRVGKGGLGEIRRRRRY